MTVVVASERPPETEAKDRTEGVAGWVHAPFNPLKFGEEIERILGVSQNSFRPPRAIEHLNGEIQRLMREP